ncbi:MAG: acyl-CoA dehydrogenase family protein [Deltaproteobacteria bacterium]|nr:acyl-CoA dehydrogenase family protein [Deltaproteobacteria bacterium]MCX7952012.1 acyl-CoA dehydrogenase family protein [Deltaproteobacteria bacterium]
MSVKEYKSNSSYVRDFFSGHNMLSRLICKYPRRSENETSLVRDLQASVSGFMGRYKDQFRQFDQNAEFSKDFFDGIKQLGLFGLIIPEEYGGLGLTSWGYSKIIETVTWFDPATAVMLGAHSSIGLRGILMYGTHDQKKRYLPELASGEKIACFCLTEPKAGSDAASIETKAIKNENFWILNGQKIWITNSCFADVFTVFARTDGQNGLISAFIVEKEFKGVSVGLPEDKMGIRASKTASVYFDNVRVPRENLLGEEGRGFKVAMTILNNGRTGLAGGAVGGMKRMYSMALEHATTRVQFGKPLTDFDIIKEKLSRMQAKIFAVEAMIDVVSDMIDQNYPDCAMEAAILKVFATESLWEACDEALQIAGGNGYMKEFEYERFLRDARINRIFEGSNEILRLFIALNGFKALAERFKNLRSVSKFYEDPIKGFGLLANYFLGPTSKIDCVFVEDLASYVQHLNKLQKGIFQLFRKIAVRESGNIVGKQMISLRVSEITMWLFVLACSVARLNSFFDKHKIPLLDYLFHIGTSCIETSIKLLAKSETDLVRSVRHDF